MTWNGSGTYNRLTTTVSPATANTTIDVADQNNYTADVATGINACLAKNGENAATGNLPMGGYKHTNVADGTAASDSTSLGQVQDSAFVYEATVGGDGDDITAHPHPDPYRLCCWSDIQVRGRSNEHRGSHFRCRWSRSKGYNHTERDSPVSW